MVNERELKEYFTVSKHLRAVNEPLVALKGEKSYDIVATVIGGGPTGQAGAIRLGIARALARLTPEFEKTMRDGRLLTRDARVKERKKYGRRGARRGFQFSKR
jgi:small subunit ribosomal protein S9